MVFIWIRVYSVNKFEAFNFVTIFCVEIIFTRSTLKTFHELFIQLREFCKNHTCFIIRVIIYSFFLI